MLIGIDASRATVAQRTGTEAYAYFLIRSLIERTAGGPHQLRLYFNDPPAPDLFPEFPHVEHRVLRFPRLWTQVRLAVELQRYAPDLFFTPAHVVPFSYRGTSVATVHDLGYHHFPGAHTRSQILYLRWSTKMNGRLSERVIADSAATKQDMMRFYGTQASKISVVYPGLDPDLAIETDRQVIASACSKYGIKEPYLLYLGTIQPRKNLDRLVRAFAATGLEHQLVLAGKPGWQTDGLPAEPNTLPASVREQILFAGYIDAEDKAALLSGADALVFPSLYEGFGFPVLEAQMCGTPVLSANSSSIPEITAGSALLVDPLDLEGLARGIQQIVRNEALRSKLVTLGFKNVQRFDWDKTAAAILQVFEEIAPSEAS